MTHSFKLSRRIARLRAPLFVGLILTMVGCNETDSLNPSSTPEVAADPMAEAGAPVASTGTPALSSSSYAGGIPIGTFAQPTTEFGSRYNGAKLNLSPNQIVRELAAIKARGGKVVLAFAGSQAYFKDGGGHFDMDKWKARIGRYRGINFTSYINDGTIIGHYLVDEPNDPANWNGRPIPPSVVEDMAKYSKQLWPGMATIVRADPGYFAGRGRYQYLDAAWAQYVSWKGNPRDYINQRVSDAQSAGLALVVGLNFMTGGPNRSRMSASQIEDWGSTLLASSYPCAFISYQYNSSYLTSSSVRGVMDGLRKKAESRGAKSCRG